MTTIRICRPYCRPTPIVLAASLAIGCGSDPVEPGATTATHDQEIPGTHAPNDLDPITAQRWVDDVRLGKALGQDGCLSPAPTYPTVPPGASAGRPILAVPCRKTDRSR